MPKHYKRKTDRGLVPEEVMKDAAMQVVEKKKGLRETAKEKGISKSTLQRYVQKFKLDPNCSLTPNYFHSRVFNAEEEDILADYLKLTSKMFHGLTALQTRRLAFEVATANSLKMPSIWIENQQAGKDWLAGFLERNPSLSLRSPEATSLARSSGFNRPCINQFFDVLEEAIKSTKVTGGRIFNLDESGLTTVQKVPKVVSQKGLKQVGQVVSRERGELVTICGIVSASGVALPPALIFPRKKFKPLFLTGAPEETLGLVAASGWMNSDLFVKVLQHIAKQTNATKDSPIIVVMDNHESHLSVPALEYAKSYGIHVVTLPPHTSHKTQPLDKSVFGPLKKYFNDNANSWMMGNPGKTVTIYEMGELIGSAWTKAATPENIISGFRVTGIWPFDRNVFSNDEFLPASVTDRPLSESLYVDPAAQDPHAETMNEVISEEPVAQDPHAETLNEVISEEPTTSSSFRSPHMIRGLPKAQMKKNKKTNRRRGKTVIATLTPEMNRIRKNDLERNAKKKKSKTAKKLRLTAEAKNCQTSSEEEVQFELIDTDDDCLDLSEDEDRMFFTPALQLGSPRLDDITIGKYVVVRFKEEKSGKLAYYVGKVLDMQDQDGDYEVDFLRYLKTSDKFVYPQVHDINPISPDDIEAILPNPMSTGSTSRTKDSLKFPVNFGLINIR